jgi:cell division protein FtsZ
MQDIQFESDVEPCARIKVIGVGGGGTNAVESMVKSGLRGVEFFVVNTDAQALARSSVASKIQIGNEVTSGRGAGADPNIGAKAAIDHKEEITQALSDADMVFITAGLGGGTGTGAAPVVAEIAKNLGILTVAVVTRPFRFEGPQRMRKANEGLERLREFVDTCIIVSNDRLLEVVGPKATLAEAFTVANNVLAMGVSSISDLIGVPGLINVDVADVRTIMNETGGAVMGVGVGKGENRATEAVKKACSSPLLDKIVIDGARGVLICVTGGSDMTLFEVNEATTMVYEAASPDANIIFGAVVDERLKDEIRVTIIATGFEDKLLRGDGKIEQKSSDDLRGGSTGGSLKDRLETILPSGNRPGASSQAKPAGVSGGSMQSQPAQNKPSGGTAVADQPTPTASALFGGNKSENQDQRSGEVFDFNRSENPLRGAFENGDNKPAQAVAENKPAESNGNKAAGQAETFEDELETPAFLKRRRNLFE